MSDIKAQNRKLKGLNSDEERKRYSREKFKNAVSSNPGNSLSYHGFRRMRTSCRPGNKVKLLDFNSFSIYGGKLTPRSGYRKINESEPS